MNGGAVTVLTVLFGGEAVKVFGMGLLLASVVVSAAAAAPVTLAAGGVTYSVDPATLQIDAGQPDGSQTTVMPALHAPQAATVQAEGAGWTWNDADGHRFHLSVAGDALHLILSAKPGRSLTWAMPAVRDGTWLVPDGEGMAYDVNDAFWRQAYATRKCLGATNMLSFPAWGFLSQSRTVSYALGDGLHSKLCLQENEGLQASLRHDFAVGAETVDLFFHIGAPDPLAPAVFYRALLQGQGRFKSFADKVVPNLPRLFAAPHAYVWGSGRDQSFLDDLKALGITRLVLSYDQDPKTHKHLVGLAYLQQALAQGYLAGPYESFDNGQPAKTADTPVAVWNDDLYPSGCLQDAKGKPVTGFGGRGCEMSSEAIARRRPFVPGERYAQHIADGASHVFVDVDAFGDFFDDFSPAHPMTMAKDRDNRLTRLGLGIGRFHLVLGSENATAWSAGVVHYSHGTGQTHVMALWPLHKDKRYGAWWPSDRPAFFFKPFQPTPDESRALFAPADRLPLFEAVFHDSVVTVDRWEVPLMKFAGEEPNRFARALLYGNPTMWALDRRELARVAPWLQAAETDFRAVHGTNAPAALTGFVWLTPDRLVQQTRYADGRSVTANFAAKAWQGLGPACVRLSAPGRPDADFCPPPPPPPFRP